VATRTTTTGSRRSRAWSRRKGWSRRRSSPAGRPSGRPPRGRRRTGSRSSSAGASREADPPLTPPAPSRPASRLAIGLALACATGLLPAPAPAAEAPGPDDLRAALEPADGRRVDGYALRPALLRRFYGLREFAPAWGPDGPGAARAGLALAALEQARDHGLDPGEYAAAALRRRREPAGLREAVERELLLTDALLRYAVDVAAGRGRAADPEWGIPRPAREEPVRELADAVESGSLAAWIEALPPPHPGYARLVARLRALHAIADRGGWPAIPAGAGPAAGRPDPRPRLLRERLVLEGDLERGAGDAAAVDRALRRFQARHGLPPDGAPAGDTLAALNVPVRARIRQVAVNLERWRWLPRGFGARYLVVNAADATLVAMEHGRATLRSRVIVGDELHPTPVLRSQVRAVVFNPPWSVPASIVTEEFLPKLRANPRFLADNAMVLLDRPADPYGLAVDWGAVPARKFPWRVQQRPGGGNPLGRIRFATPNRFDVYLHDTPLPELFQRTDRALSHGCVRVEHARELAALVLAGQPAGRPAALAQALATDATRVMAVADPLPVWVLYWTAFVDEEGRLQLRDDVYDRDARVAAALSRGGGSAATGAGGPDGRPRAVPARPAGGGTR
jgi:murein L,D-transpeptidase YcbB/YkuD